MSDLVELVFEGVEHTKVRDLFEKSYFLLTSEKCEIDGGQFNYSGLESAPFCCVIENRHVLGEQVDKIGVRVIGYSGLCDLEFNWDVGRNPSSAFLNRLYQCVYQLAHEYGCNVMFGIEPAEDLENRFFTNQTKGELWPLEKDEDHGAG